MNFSQNMSPAAIIFLGFLAVATSQSTSSTISQSVTSTPSLTTTPVSSSTGLGSSVNILGSYTLDGAVSYVTDPVISVPSGPYVSYSRQILISSSTRGSNTTNLTATRTSTDTLILKGTYTPTGTNSRNISASTTSTSIAPTNTQPCNGYPEFCERKYSNITEVCAHNSAFVRAGSAASNQEISIIGQLNDGIRMFQGETHYNSTTGEIRSCHTSCDLLDAGPLLDQLLTIRDWVSAHPYDVLTLLLVNSDFAGVGNYSAVFEQSGLVPYIYTPPKIPMYYDDWPILSNMILTGKRVVVFLDYQADQTQVPYILDEFSQMWETPFSPTEIEFPCTQQRPPGLDKDGANNLMYLANHNLNVELSLLGTDILIPNFSDLEQVNSVNGTGSSGPTGSLGDMATSCANEWVRPPRWLLVDFYNYGNGSVFEVAATMNNVTYTGKCCGTALGISMAPSVTPKLGLVFIITVLLWALF